MYTSQELVDRLKDRSKSKNILIKTLLSECDLNVNTLNQLSEKKGLSSFSLARIADYLDCSVDYLLGRTEIPEVNTLDNMVRIYTAARSRNGDAYGEAEVQTVRQSLIDRLRAAPDASDDL